MISLAENVPYSAAFIAGVLSFFSPCVLPLLPAYFTFITGFSLEELTDGDGKGVKGRAVLYTAAYIAGFSFIFIMLGASASLMGSLAAEYKDFIRIPGGIIIIILGLHMTGVFRIGFLEYEKRARVKRKSAHVLSVFAAGAAFAAGWTPCIGPLLGSILVLAGSQETVWRGVGLLATYSAGFAVFFIIAALFVTHILTFLKKARRVVRYVNLAAGVILIATGAWLVIG